VWRPIATVVSADQPRKHVRFNPVTQRRFSEDFGHFRPEQLITTGASSGPKSILASSRTFPVSVLKQRRPSMDAEGVRDFLERSNSISVEVRIFLLRHRQTLFSNCEIENNGSILLCMHFSQLQRYYCHHMR
jgi:hypothetical protein